MTKTDFEVVKSFKSTPQCFRVMANTKRGDAFMRKWIAEDDPPTRGRDGRLFAVLVDSSARDFLADAVRVGLEV